MIIVFDCNIWISLALNQQLEFISLLQKDKIDIASCGELQTEIENVLIRPKFKKHFSNTYVERFLQFYKISTVTFQIGEIEEIVTDEKDNYLFALCKAAKADYFVTGDKLLLAVTTYHHTKIISLSEFRKSRNK